MVQITPGYALLNITPNHKTLALIALSLCLTLPAHPQGCTQCRDNTAATPPATQRAYRHAILLLTLSASGLFLATLAILKRQR